MKTTCWGVFLSLFLALPLTHAADDMKAFPPAEAGMTRHVLQLAKKKDESAYKVELIVGKQVTTDEANRYFFSGKIDAENIDGWGYTLYKVAKIGPMAGTLMAVDPQAPQKKRFITLAGEPYLISYNSRLPVVVYVPEGAEVKYRLWSVVGKTKTIRQD